MDLRERARIMAESGDYSDADAVIFALFKLGYARAPSTIGFRDRLRLNFICRSSMRRERSARH